MIADSPKVAETGLRQAIRFALIQQSLLATLCLLMLDGGRAAKLCAATAVGYWLGVAWLLAVRPHRRSPGDLRFIRWGFLPLFLVAALAARRLVGS